MLDSINTILMNPILMPNLDLSPGTSNIPNYNIKSADEIHPSLTNQPSLLSLGDQPQQYSLQHNPRSKQFQGSTSNLQMQVSSQRQLPISANCPRSSVSSSPTSHSSLFSASDSQMDILTETNDSMSFQHKTKPCSWEPYTAAQINKSSSSVINNASINITVPNNGISQYDKSLDFVDFSPWLFTDHSMTNTHRRQKSNFFNSSTVINSLTTNFTDSGEANKSTISEITELFDKFSLNPANGKYSFLNNTPNNRPSSNEVITRRNSDFTVPPLHYNSSNVSQPQSRAASTANISSHFANNNEMNNFIHNNGSSISMESTNNCSNNQLNQKFDSVYQSRPSSSHWISNNNALTHHSSRHSTHLAKSHSLSLPSSSSNSSTEVYRNFQAQQQSISNNLQSVSSSAGSANRPNFRRGNSIALESDCLKVSNLVNQLSKRPASAHAYFPNGNAQLTNNGALNLHTINTSGNLHRSSSSSSASPIYSPVSVLPPMSAGSCPNVCSNNNNNSHSSYLGYNHSRGGSITSLNHYSNSNGNTLYFNDGQLRRNTVAVASSYNDNSTVAAGNNSKNMLIPNINGILTQNNMNNGIQTIYNDDTINLSTKITGSINETVIPNNIVITSLTNAANAMTSNGSFSLLNANNISKHTRKTFRNNQKLPQVLQAEKEEPLKSVSIEKEVLVKYKNISIKQLEPQILMLSKDQNGCRFLQKRIEEYSYTNTPEEVEESCRIIYRQVKTIIQDLIINSFGNYLVQKLFDHLSVKERTEILKICENQLKQIALNQHGTRALQHMIEFLTIDEQIKIIVEQLKSHVVELIKNLNGNHVIQKCLVQFTNKKHIQFIVDGVCDGVFEVASHRHGCCVLQKTLDYSDTKQFQQIGKSVLKNGLELLQDAYGNYVVQHLLSSSKHPDSIKHEFLRLIGLEIQGHLKNLSVQKYASNVVEKCIKSLDDEKLQEELILEVLRLDTLKLLIRDPYGNYVVQAMLDIVLFNDIKSHAIESLSKVLEDIPEDDVYARKIAQRVTDKSQK